jgi:RHS repeat-associated protein
VTRPSDNAQLWTWFSDPFGADAANPNPAGAGTFAYNLRFPGQLFDGQAGLHYNGLRDYDPAIGKFVESDPVGIVSGINTFSYASSNSLSVFDPSGLSSAIYNPSAGVVTVVNGAGVSVGTFPAANNAQSSSNGPWPPGDYSFNQHVTHPDDGPDSKFGSYGNFQFNVPGRSYMGIHSGHRDSTDKAGRQGYRHATDGCIRTTDDATRLLEQLMHSGDPLTSLIVTDSPVATNIPSVDPSLNGGPTLYPPDPRL